MNPEIIVHRSGLFQYKNLDTKNQAVLVSLESLKNIPFDIERVYTISNFKDTETVRGAHAHYITEQIIFSIQGSFILHLDDGVQKQDIVLSDPTVGVRLGKMLWHNMRSFSPDCVIMVIADRVYEESDYIRNYSDFLNAMAYTPKDT